jgi:hypothetical protein
MVYMSLMKRVTTQKMLGFLQNAHLDVSIRLILNCSGN